MKKMVTLLAFFSIFCSGCVFNKYYETSRYDLIVERANNDKEFQIFAAEFDNISGSGTRMLIKYEDGQIETDPYNKWMLPPEELIPKTLNSIFPIVYNPTSTKNVTGKIKDFYIDDASKSFVFSGSYKIDAEKHHFYYSVPMKDQSAMSATLAATAVIKKLAENIMTEQ